MANVSAMSMLDYCETSPPYNPVVHRALKVINSGDCDVAELARIISTDSRLAVGLLRWGNSAYYGLSHTITSVDQAIMVMGLRQVKLVLLSLPLDSNFIMASTVYRVGRHALWRRTVAQSIVVSLLHEIPYDREGETLFDTLPSIILFGKVVLSTYALRAGLTLPMPDRGCTEQEYEKQLFGITHLDVVEAVAENWDLPDEIIEIASFLKKEDSAGDTPFTTSSWGAISVVIATDLVCRELGVGCNKNVFAYPDYPNTIFSQSPYLKSLEEKRKEIAHLLPNLLASFENQITRLSD